MECFLKTLASHRNNSTFFSDKLYIKNHDLNVGSQYGYLEQKQDEKGNKGLESTANMYNTGM